MNEDVVRLPINGTLDLHAFHPKEVKPLIDEYILACLKKGIHEGKIIHGKGIGTQRNIVQNKLKSNPLVRDYWIGDEQTGSWGVTKFSLKC